MKTLKEISKALNVSVSTVSRIKKEIESNHYFGVPEHMIWGTGDKKNYNLKTFENENTKRKKRRLSESEKITRV